MGNSVLKADPRDQCGGNREVEKALVRDGEYDEERSEGEEDDDQAMEVVVVGAKGVEEWYDQGCNWT